MISTRQLEALVWAVRLKTLSRAAARLNMAQPTISKRIHELESTLGYEVFSKTGRSVTLTPQGTALYDIAEKIIALLQEANEIGKVDIPHRQSVMIGVTELIAYTWLPDLVDSVRTRHSNLDLHISIEQSSTLLAKLRSGDLDLIVTPAHVAEPQIVDLPAADVRLSLLASPSLCTSGKPYSGQELSEFRFISHGFQTGSIGALASWIRDIGCVPLETIELDSIAAQVGLVSAGMGIALMPSTCFGSLIDAGKLIEVNTSIDTPTLRYRIAFREHDLKSNILEVAKTIQSVANFSQLYHDRLKEL